MMADRIFQDNRLAGGVEFPVGTRSGYANYLIFNAPNNNLKRPLLARQQLQKTKRASYLN
jgi:hypothetical protein